MTPCVFVCSSDLASPQRDLSSVCERKSVRLHQLLQLGRQPSGHVHFPRRYRYSFKNNLSCHSCKCSVYIQYIYIHTYISSSWDDMMRQEEVVHTNTHVGLRLCVTTKIKEKCQRKLNLFPTVNCALHYQMQSVCQARFSCTG